jgi:pimeloyl-ACP methyl ester carboxylesterase
VTVDQTRSERDGLTRAATGAAWRLDRGPTDAKVVLLVHGLGSIAEEIFQAVGPRLLSEGFRVIAFDRPGYGGSEGLRSGPVGPAAQAEWFAGQIEAIGIDVAVIAAHSFGAAVALCLARRLQTPPALVLINPFCKPTPPAAAPLMRLGVAPAIGPFVRRKVIPAVAGPLVRTLVARACAPDPVPQALKALPPQVLTRESAVVAMAAELRQFNGDVAKLPGAQGCGDRLVALSGARDRVIPGPAHAEWLRAVVPATEHRCLQTGHMLHHVKPDAVVEAVTALAA